MVGDVPVFAEHQTNIAPSKKDVRDPHFAARLKRVCDEHSGTPDLHYGRLGWIRHQLGERFDQAVSAETVRRWLAGEAIPRRDKIVSLASLFEVNIAWLSLGVGPARSRSDETSFVGEPANASSAGQSKPQNWLDLLRKELAGTVTIPAGVDITEPTGEIWDAEL